MTTAMIRCLRARFPLAQIDMVVREEFLSLIQYNPHLDRKIGIKRKKISEVFKLLKEINRQRYDVVYDAHFSLRTLLLMPFVRCDKKIYLKKNYLKRTLALLLKWKSLIRDSPRMLERFITPLMPLGVRYDKKGPELFLPETASMRALFEKWGLNPETRYIGMIPSAQWPGKRWPIAYFRKTLESLLQNTQEFIIVFGGPSDHFCRSLVEGLNSERIINLQGKISLLEVFQVFSIVKCCLANDTGLMHVADAMGIPSVVLFGPTHADLGCKPFHPLSHILEKDLWCRPCSKNGEAPCIRGHRWCLSLIKPEEAVSALRHLLHQINSLPIS